jgi:hypothetical protein
MPFYGSKPYKVECEFRFKLRDSKLQLGYLMDRPHDVERAAFGDIVEIVLEGSPDVISIAGVA